MSEPTPLPRSATEVANQPTEESVDTERDVVGDQPDEGGLVDQDKAQ
jgi:hypothetical protein